MSDLRGSSSARTSSLDKLVPLYFVSVAGALVLSGLLVMGTGGSPIGVLSALLDGSILAPGRWGLTLGTAAPLLLVAVGTIVSSRSGLVNIGQEGQLLVGAACAALVATHLGGPGDKGLGGVVVLGILLAGVLGGAFWAGIAGGLRVWRGVPEVLSTLLLVTVSANVVGAALKSERWLLTSREDRSDRTLVSAQLDPSNRLGRVSVFGNEFPISVFLALGLAGFVAFFLVRTVPGFRLRMLGQNPFTAQRAGVDASRYSMLSMLASGGFAGLAGAAMLAGGDFGNYRFSTGFSASIGWTGLLVALVAREKISAAIGVAFLFAGLRTGSGFLAATGVERKITTVIEALLVLALLIPPAIVQLRGRREQMKPDLVGEMD